MNISALNGTFCNKARKKFANRTKTAILRLVTGRQLKIYRDALGESQRDIAERLGDVSHATVSRWEADADADIPGWAEQRLTGDKETIIELQLGELHDLLNLAEREGKAFPALLTAALREYIAKRTRDGVVIGSLLAEQPGEYPGSQAAGEGGTAIDEAMKEQTAAIKKLIQKSAEPPPLRLHPKPEDGADAGSEGNRRKPA